MKDARQSKFLHLIKLILYTARLNTYNIQNDATSDNRKIETRANPYKYSSSQQEYNTPSQYLASPCIA